MSEAEICNEKFKDLFLLHVV